MSRHSKNCTASSVFTYAEKQKLRDYGMIKVRVGSQSQRSFNMCHLCLSPAESPQSCLKGHIFCKVCIVEYLVEKKTDYKRNLASFKREKEEMEKRNEETRNIERQKELEKYENFRLTNFKQEIFESENEKAIQQMQDFRAGKIKLSKEDSKKYNFWLPENQIIHKEEIGTKPSKVILCPADLKHEIKYKNLIELHVSKDQNCFLCVGCKRELQMQKAKLSKLCGHVFCLSCFESICKGNCGVCSLKFEEKDVIELKAGDSSFSAHSNVEAVKYHPIFN